MEPETQRRSYDRNGFQNEERQNQLMSYLVDQELEAEREKRWQLLLPRIVALRHSGKDGEKRVIAEVREGVSDRLRHKVWPLLVQDPLLNFEDCRDKCDNKEVSLDLERTFPTHKEAKSLEERMKVVLNALVMALPEVGYCQGMNFIVGTLLLRLGEEEAFRVAYHVFHWQKHEQLLRDLKLIHEQLYALHCLTRKHFRRLHEWLSEQEIEPILYASSWFITLYCNSLPACYAFRIIESFLLEGEKILYRVALQILKWKKRRLKAKAKVEDIVEELKNYDEFNEGNVDLFFREMFQIQLSREEIRKYRQEYHSNSPKNKATKA